MVMKAKRGQAAMEFLMTYGWAILVVLVVIGALAYFGVLSPKKLLPDKCTLPPGLLCDDYALSADGGVQMVIANGLGKTVTITSILVTEASSGSEICSGTLTPTSKVTITNGKKKSLGCAAAGIDAFAGEKTKFEVTLKYVFGDGTDSDALKHVAEGEIFATVQKSTAP